MKASAKSVWGPAAVFLLALTTLFFTSTISSSIPIPQEMTSPDHSSGQKRLRREHPNNQLELSVDGSALVLLYQFKDFLDQDQKFSCRVNFEASQSLRNSFGLAVCPHSSGEENLANDICWRHAEKGGERNFFGYLRSISRQDEYMGARGFIQNKEEGEVKWVLDYPALVLRSSAALDDCAKSFNRIGLSMPETLMAFLLAIPRKEEPLPEVDPDVNKWVAGFRLPSSVMIQNEGDCDSKAALFCVLMGNSKRRVVIFRSESQQLDGAPQLLGGTQNKSKSPVTHALIGIEAESNSPNFPERIPNHWEEGYLQPGTYRDGFEFGNAFQRHKYIPIEVSGPGRTEIGEVALLDEYDNCKDQRCPYVAIPIVP